MLQLYFVQDNVMLITEGIKIIFCAIRVALIVTNGFDHITRSACRLYEGQPLHEDYPTLKCPRIKCVM